MGKLEDIEARLERLERPCAPPGGSYYQDGFEAGARAREKDNEERYAATERGNRILAERQRDEAVAKLDEANDRLASYKRGYDNAMQGWGTAGQERDAAVKQAAVECEGRHRADQERDKWHSANTILHRWLAEAEAKVSFLTADNGTLAVELRDAEERARDSWQGFGRKLDEAYPGRDKGEAPDDYALRALHSLKKEVGDDSVS